jgi:hypothetical protein
LLFVAARPILLDHCLEACAASSATAATPACHHLSEPRLKIGFPPQPCGHDHGAVMLGANTVASHERLFAPLALVVELVTLGSAPPEHGPTSGVAPARWPATYVGHSAPLRV